MLRLLIYFLMGNIMQSFQTSDWQKMGLLGIRLTSPHKSWGLMAMRPLNILPQLRGCVVRAVIWRRALDKTKAGIEKNLVDWAKPYLGDGRKLIRIMDPSWKEGQYPQRAAYSVAMLALRCLSSEAKVRPRMSEVLASLEQLQVSKDVAKRLRTEQPRGARQAALVVIGRFRRFCFMAVYKK
ncbi:protein kinase 2B, chloroplastic isoform X1 [Cinnamomum micranthum f. kanehirae]|uniref:Protein kinase 2B, chloroplastic isoform X1 n=1 Tax=Cinnamomum micranthum f. kanehirae TaxID=337451 RepID=A0A3S3Q051_9MAGN|nr:protein kinase 2B, chloroplastic isoform X1 [Cinnamomum micranthum f. kanehirae]